MANEIITQGRYTWRDWNTDGIPATGAHEPAKADAREFARLIQDQINSLISSLVSNALHKDTLANLELVTGAAAGVGAFVWSDSTPANKGIYESDGAGGWDKIADLPEGIVGPTGDTGPTGLSGANYQGPWEAGTYVYRDLVWHEPTLTVWYCDVESTVGIPGDNTDWIVFADISAAVAARDAAQAYAAAAAASASSASGHADDAEGFSESAATSASSAATNAALAGSAAVGNQPLKAIVDLAFTEPPEALSGLPVIDGDQSVAGMRVLVPTFPNTGQSDPLLTAKSNGVYVTAVGAWSRATDADSAEKISGMVVIVKGGVQNFGRTFVCRSTVVTLGTDAIVFEPQYQGGRNLQSVAAASRGVYAILGDSNTASEKTHYAWMRGRFNPVHGPMKDWLRYRVAASGAGWQAYANTILYDSLLTPSPGAPDRDEEPEDMGPSGSGNSQTIWQFINALNKHENSIGEFRIGTNDFGLAGAGTPPVNRASGGPGHPVTFARNVRNVIAFVLANTNAELIITLPQPFGGQEAYVIGPDDFTRFEVDASDGTRETGAAERTAEMYAELRKWKGRNPRVHVMDTGAEVYPDERCDTYATQCLDQMVPATFKGYSIPASSRRLISDALHFTSLGAQREEEFRMRFLGLVPDARATFQDYDIIGPKFDWSTVVDGEFVHWETASNSGADTLLKIRGSVENLAWRGPLTGALNVATGMQRYRALAEGERMLMTKRHGFLRRLLDNYRGQVKVYFPYTGNSYTLTGISQSSVTADGDDFSEKFWSLTLAGANMGGESTLHNTTDLGYTGTVQYENTRRLAFIYVEKRDFSGERWNIKLDIPNGQVRGVTDGWIWETGSEIRIARQFRATRSGSSPSTLAVALYLGTSGFGAFNSSVSKAGCTISGTTLTTPNGTSMAVGMNVTGSGVTSHTYITAKTSDTEWTVNISQTVGSFTATIGAMPTGVKQGCSISGTTLTTPDGYNIAVGQTVTGTGVTGGTTITARTNETTYTVSASQTVGPVAMTFGSSFDGLLVGTFNFGASEVVATFLPHHLNINMMIAAGLWPGAADSGWVGIGNAYHLRAIANSAPTGQVALTIAN